VCRVPACPALPLHRIAHDRAWQPAHDATPPTPCPLADRTDPDKPGFRRTQAKTETPSIESLRHRYRHPYA
jgi:hypothetical protein